MKSAINKGQQGPEIFDVIDVGFLPSRFGRKHGLIQPYKVATWDENTVTAPRTPEGHQASDYYGVLAFRREQGHRR